MNILGYIYKITNTKNGLIYIGQKRSPEFLGTKYLGSGVLIKEAVKEFGKDCFQVDLIEEIHETNKFEEREVYWIDYYNATDRSIGYNICKNGHVEVLSGEANPFYGKRHSAESRAKMSDAHKHCEHHK